MTVHQFPDRRREVATRRRTRHAASLAKSTLTLWLIPWLFWLSLIDALDNDGGDGDRGR